MLSIISETNCDAFETEIVRGNGLDSEGQMLRADLKRIAKHVQIILTENAAGYEFEQ